MEHKEKEVVIDIENGDANDSSSDSTWGKKSLNIVTRILNLNGSVDDEAGVKSDVGSEEELASETTKLLGDKASEGEEGEGLMPPAERDNERGGEGRVPPVEKEKEKERRKGGKVKKAAKPPRPPKGPTLDAADMRLLKEISRLAIKKRERMERLKALKKTRSPRLPSSLSSSSSSSSVCSSAATISALFVTVFFFLVLILQGLNSSTSSTLIITGAPQPQPAPVTRGSSPVQFYKTAMSDDGAAPSFLPPKSG
ncbi:uncharacterized protein LOC131000390 isoform X2 [Salvia miltiorrhiza]|uniref:uncharacterized protein LOC131000390 isoform X2 n=1 Tax=Salvia miltiorrhiza TaxID=226208 RepID=UPI0025ABB716|nr:uncharacterized protein LOC131000390 isoform X2 [Salvia miltiorrhiza]